MRPGPRARIYPIRVAARRAGIQARLIRVWESQGLLVPGRTAGGHRLYSAADIAWLREIKRLREQGAAIEGIAKMVARR